MKRGIKYVAVLAVLCFALSAQASTTMEFGSVQGKALADITNLGSVITLELNSLELKNMSPSDNLFKATLSMSDITIDASSKQVIFGNTVSYSVNEETNVGGFALFAQVDGVGGLERVLFADIDVDLLVTTDAVGSVDADISVDLSNFTLDNVTAMNANWGSVPTLLTDFVQVGLADMVINITAEGGLSISDAIDSGNFLPNIIVNGTVQAVPEPGAMALSFLGIAYFARRIKRKIS